MASHLEASILVTIKKMLGLDMNYNAFDSDIITHINTALMTLQQLGVGPDEGMFITGISETWDNYFSSDKMLEAAKTYIYIQVKMVFDPPTNSFVMDSLQKTSDMLEWRLKEQARFYDSDTGKYVRRVPEPVLFATTGTSASVDSEEAAIETGLYPVHIERDGITPLDDLGQNTVMRGE